MSSIKLAIIPPIAYLEDFSTDYHLALAHLLKSSPSYFYYYLKHRRAGEFVIMDNGAAELNSAIDSEELYKIACELKPSVLVCPDVLHNGDATIESTAMFLRTYGNDLESKGIELMGVPQGKTSAEWFGTFSLFNRDPRLAWLGISKYTVGAYASRLNALMMIEPDVKKPCHLLGLADNMDIVKKEKAFSFVQSTDTAVPIKLGMQKLGIDGYSKQIKMKDDDYFFQAPKLTMDQYWQILGNIETYKEYCI